ncbi:MAG: hypothetical protein DRN16_03350 [Thermoplasmata archaeon]|nr:MAG: hypothetical protein DRN16_03350 [Thermoplasmata archaeon]
MKIFLETYGCDTSKNATEIMAGALLKNGHNLVSKEAADVIIINSCALTGQTEKKILKRLTELKDSGKKVLVAGCLPEVSKEKIEFAMPEASIMGVTSFMNVAGVIEKMADYKVERLKDRPDTLIGKQRIRINPAVGIVQIAEGCLDNCTFCVERTTRGTLVSYEPDAIIREVQKAVDEGIREIHLTAQDVAAYGFDTGVRLPALLRKLSCIQGDFKIKLGSMNPANVLKILDDLILAFNHPKIYRFLDIPIQSGSNKILYAMKRNYTNEEFKMIVAAFRKKYPDMNFSTDVLVGFPGETDEDYGKTVNVVTDVKPDVVNIYQYTKRPFASAGDTDVPSWKVKNRAVEMEQLADKLQDKSNETWVGWRGTAIVSEKTPKGYLARNYVYKPIVLPKANIGDVITVDVVGTYGGNLVGR